jgi:RNA polymerase sigma-70 factor (ECF subfamily)
MDESSRPASGVDDNVAPSDGASVVLAGRHEPVLRGLIERMARGDEPALGQLYDQTSGIIFALALRMLRQREDAEEVTLDAYTRAWRNAVSYDPKRASVIAWLVMMARSIAIDRIRSGAGKASKTETLENPMDQPSSEAGPEMATWIAQQRERVLSALEQLPVEQRTAVELAFFGGLSHAELAEATRAPLGTVKTRVRLGIARLRQLLEDLA